MIMLKLTDLSRVDLKSLKRWRKEDPCQRVLLNTGFFATVREMAGCRRQTFNLPQASSLTKVCRNLKNIFKCGKNLFVLKFQKSGENSKI